MSCYLTPTLPVKILKITKSYFILGSNSDLELKALHHYILTLSFLYTQLTSFFTISFILTTIVHIRSIYFGQYQITKYGCLTVEHRFYILLLVIVMTMFHIFLVFKSWTCNVLASFDINFVSPLGILFLKFPSLVSVLLSLLLFWNWDNRRAGQHSTHAEAKVLFQLSISDSDLADIRILWSLV